MSEWRFNRRRGDGLYEAVIDLPRHARPLKIIGPEPHEGYTRTLFLTRDHVDRPEGSIVFCAVGERYAVEWRSIVGAAFPTARFGSHLVFLDPADFAVIKMSAS